MEKGEIVTIPTPKTIADGAQAVHIGEETFKIMRQNVDGILTVTDQQLIDNMKFCAQTMKIIVEPTGCLALAGMRNSGFDFKDKRIGVIISGGNVDL